LRVRKNDNSKEILSKITPIFRDCEELPTDSNLSNAIINALEASNYLIVICSLASAKSQWVNKEIIDFKKLHGENKVLAMIVDGEPNAIDKPNYFDPEKEAFPEALKYKVNELGHLTDERIEPLAADARESGDGKERAKIKLIAGLLGVGFDDLWRREKRRQKKRKIIWGSIISLLFIIISTLSVVSLVKWQESEYQKKIAIDGREAAESLIEHTLFDLRDKLEPFGKLELLSSTFEAVDLYYHRLGISNASSNIHFRIATYHANSGSYFKNIGDLSKAKKHFIVALGIMKKLVTVSPSDTLLQRNYAVIHSELGTIMEAMGHYEEAQEYIQTAHNSLHQLSSQNLLNMQLKFELAKSYGKLGGIQQIYEKPKKVMHNFNVALKMMEELVRHDSNNTQWKNDKAATHVTYGAYLGYLNKSKQALEQFIISLEIRKELVDSNPDNYLYKHSLSESYKYIGSIYLSYLENLKEAEKSFQMARDIMYKLVEHDPTNAQWQNSLARSHDTMGDLQIRLGQREYALKEYNKSIQMLNKLSKDDPHNFSLQVEFALESSKVGNIYLEDKKQKIAKKHLENALDTMQKLVKVDADNFTYRYVLAILYDDLSTLYRHQYSEIDIDNFYTNVENIQQINKDFKKGLKYFVKSVTMLEKLKVEDPTNIVWNMFGNNILQLGDVLNIK